MHPSVPVVPPSDESARELGRDCVCPRHADAVACIDPRYYGYSPGPNSELDARDECQCICRDVEREEDDL